MGGGPTGRTPWGEKTGVAYWRGVFEDVADDPTAGAGLAREPGTIVRYDGRLWTNIDENDPTAWVILPGATIDGAGGDFTTGTPTPSQLDIGDATSAGTAGTLARADHQHAFPAPAGTPADVATAAAAGSATTPARSDHAHALADDVVTNAKLRNSSARSVIGRSPNSAGDPADIAGTGTASVPVVLTDDGTSVTWAAVTKIVQNLQITNITTATISADQNDYAGFSTDQTLRRLNPNANPRTITGIASGADGRLIFIANISATNALALAHESASSTATNRISTPTGATFSIPANSLCPLWYDNNAQRWKPWGVGPIPATATPAAVAAAGAVGTSAKYALEDHAHAGVTSVNGSQGAVIVMADRTVEGDSAEVVDSSDWAVNALAPAGPDATNPAEIVRAFDDTSEEGLGFGFWVPEGATNLVLTVIAWPNVAPAAARTAGLKLYARRLQDNTAIGAWASVTVGDFDIEANRRPQEKTFTIALAAFSVALVAGAFYHFELTRVNPGAGTELVGDLLVRALRIRAS